MKIRSFRAGRASVLAGIAAMLYLSSCSPKDQINKVTSKCDNKQYTNTCQSFTAEVTSLIEANAGASALKVAQYDDTEFSNTFFLEPGQFELKGDTLYFRLANDLDYCKYLVKGVAIQVKASYTAQESLRDIEKDPQGDLGMLVVNEAYYKANKTPFLLYKMPVPGGKLDGKQLSLQFSVVKYNKAGVVTKVFCETDKKPLGPLDAPVATAQPWEPVKPKSVVQLPDLTIADETYHYKGFTGSLDLIFPMNSTKFERKEIDNVMRSFVAKYQDQGYKVTSVNMTGYASQGGKVEFNQNLSERRSSAVYDDLIKSYEKIMNKDSVKFSHDAKGEDWERFDLLVNTATFTEAERASVKAITDGGGTLDDKEAKLRKLPFWNKLVSEVLVYCRHVFVTYGFDYIKDHKVSDYYPEIKPIIDPELYNAASKDLVISRYKPGVDAKAGLATANQLIGGGSPTANMYALRSTYQYGQSNTSEAIKDIERAQGLDAQNQQYGLAALAYKTQNAYNYSIQDRLKLLNTYNDYVARFPNDNSLSANRAVMEDAAGYISGAEADYTSLTGKGQNSAAIINNRGVAKLKTFRLTEAEADFEQAATTDPKLAEAFYNQGVVAAYKGLTDKAVAALDKAIALNPSFKADIQGNPVFKVMRDSPKFAHFR